MARRIAASILLTVWAILVVGGFVTYGVTRAVLISDLDDLLTQRAVSLAEATARGESEETATTRPISTSLDRYLVTDGISTVRASGATPSERPAPPPHKGAFGQLADGTRVRTVNVGVPVAPIDGSGRPRTLTVVYIGPADQVFRVLSRLAVTLTVAGLAAGAAAAGVAVAVARAALRPLNAASEVIGEIDESRLDRRIDPDSLPPELRPAAAKLNEMLERLERAFQQRKQFLADASHELRTPVAALVTTIEVALRRRRGAEELTRTLETCLADARHLKRLVHVLMEHARGEASATSGEQVEQVDASQLLGECADMAAALGAGRDVRVERSLPASMPFLTQPQRLRSVATNLLSNAVEYNRPGGLVHLSASLNGTGLELTVRDTGRGIAPEHVPYLFEPFYRAEGSRPASGGEETPHLGLGLFLVDSHLKALGGRCTVRSEPGVGTIMHVSVPGSGIPPADATPVQAAAPAAPQLAPPASGHGGSPNLGGAAENIRRPAELLKGMRNSR
jgi:signal transduction histidine kinase